MHFVATFRTHIGDPIPYDPSITSEQLALKVFLVTLFYFIYLLIYFDD